MVIQRDRGAVIRWFVSGGMGLSVPGTPQSVSRLEPHPLCTHMDRNSCITWLPIEAVQHHTFGRCPATEKKLPGHLRCQTAGDVTNARWPFRRDVRVPETRASCSVFRGGAGTEMLLVGVD